MADEGSATLGRVRREGTARRWPVVLVLVALSIACSAVVLDVRVNWTGSMPRGLYRMVAPRLKVGSLVAICLPRAVASLGRERGYLPPGGCPDGSSPIVKQVVAKPGDEVRLTAAATFVNGRGIAASGLQVEDSEGRPLVHHPLGTTRLGGSEYWVSGMNRSRSWDSRYFGPVRAGDIHGSVVPLLICGSSTEPGAGW